MSNQALGRLWCNDVPVELARPMRVLPGERNRLVAAASAGSAAAALHVETVAPDGRTRCQRVALTDGRAEVDLGPLCVPAVYEYESGVVFRRGYRLEVRLERRDGTAVARRRFAAVCSQDRDAEWLLADAPDRCVYNDGFIPENGTWNPFGESAGAMQPPLQARLAPGVLVDQDDVVVCCRTRPEPGVKPMRVRGRIIDAGGTEMIEPVELTVDAQWCQWRVDVGSWPAGAYTIELQPVIEGTPWADGPHLRYQRVEANARCIRVSPYAPFSLEHDEARPDVRITDWPEPLPAGWELATCGGHRALLCAGDPDAAPVRVDPQLAGWYAVFVQPVNALHVRVGGADVMRRVHEPECSDFGDMFVHVVDLTGQTIDLYPNDLKRLLEVIGDVAAPAEQVLALYEKDGTRSAGFSREVNDGEIRSGVRHIRLVPVTEASVQAFRDATAHPPHELRGVADWWCYFLGPHRVEREQLDTIMRGQREVGISALNWAVGRSWVQYPSRLPRATMFPCAEIDSSQPAEKRQHWVAWQRILRACDALAYPLAQRQTHDMRLHGWLAMNRHYGVATLGGVFTSPWARSHPEYYQYRKCLESEDYTRMEYYFDEVREERLDILEEAASYGPDALVIGCCRQPPMAGYNPRMVADYREQTGIDPTTLDIDAGEPYLRWIQWRADFFTELMRELARRLEALATRTGQRVAVIARIPDVGLQWNLAQGMDVRTWVSEGLVDELQLDPLECAAGRASHDVREYLELGRAHGVRVLGGVNGTTGANRGHGSLEDFSPVVGLRRAIGLLRAGVDGIEIYESELFARTCERRWLIPLWGDPDRAERWLAESNLEAVFPVTARNAALGHDNHWFGGETLHGIDRLPRGTKRAL